MDGWERLKFGAAITGVVFLISVLRWTADLVYPETYVTEPAYKIPGVSEPAVDLSALQRSWPAGLSEPGGRAKLRDYMSNIEKVAVPRSAEGPPAVAAPAPQVDLATLLAAADVEKGRQTARVCTSCHTFDQGGQDRIGPSLWGVVGRDVAARETFTYSSVFAAQSGSWTYERLDRYLTNPAKAVPGNKMAFAGLRKAEDRANVIAFLSTLSASPVPFPKAEKPKIAETLQRPRQGSRRPPPGSSG
ncbi:cytochrome c family protein [Phenylobacterium sp. Root700]|uniref:c-type cytochrome n=2 Tax=unclassified Phenylobacterium TaxID=2640670 RepID=UPI001F31FB50|nr:cytochrome c family protein [Phenylobacterium sp. Root700]